MSEIINILEKYNFWNNEKIDTGFYREFYLKKIDNFTGNKLIKVILGQRRVGKSYILRMIINNLINKNKVSRKNILCLNMDIFELKFIRNSEILNRVINEYIKEFNPKGKIFLFVDDVQEIEQWEKIINSLSQDYKRDFEIFITGSNANLLSTELSTYLSGRYITINILPFDYNEFLEYFKLKRNKESFLKYLKMGGLPELYKLNDESLRYNYITNLKDSIILKDIVQRFGVRNIRLLERLFEYLIDTIGTTFSTNSIVKHLKSNGYSVNHELIDNYIKYITMSYSIHEVKRYDIQGKKILTGEKKYYVNDIVFKNYISSNIDYQIGKILENIVYLSLIKRGYNVFIGKLRNKEVDFIAENNEEKIYIQVTYVLADKSVIDREFGNLKSIRDNYKKIVLSMDDLLLGNIDGIEHKRIYDFL